ncbi:DUF2147 domain-containing protein [Thermomonas sp.]|uniref:DUF2147 domain-containing protein n=1 Tax=Thermomonas sp. TaxID=1971895 RepID=UPI002601700F|nr:DUF2147 domain-containing protein [Thermomonas sp.]
MRKMILAAVLSAFAFSAGAQNHASPIGKWRTLDDKTGKPMTITEIYAAQNGTLAARIVENLGMPATCTECSGQYKNKPFVGIVTLWNLKPTGQNTWGGGNGYKPSEDRNFKVKSVTLVDGGRKLEVKGCVAFICRTATWVRAD